MILAPRRAPRPRFGPLCGLLLLALLALRPPTVHAQAGPAIGGTVLGAAAGTWWTVSVLTARARAGHVAWKLDDIKPVGIPMIIGGAGAGLALGLWAGDRVDEALWGGLIGGSAGFAVGWLVGDFLWDDPTGSWAGAAIASGIGLAAGAVIGAWGSEGTDIPGEGGGAVSFGWSWRPGR